MTRKEIMEDNSVHFLTKNILKLTEDKDVVDRYYDALLACKVLKTEMEYNLHG